MFQVLAPSVSAISPRSGPTSGGTAVTIDGTGFWSGPVQVEFCVPGSVAACTPATSDTALSDTELTAESPPLGPGPVDVRVQGVGGLSATVAADLFTFGGTAAGGTGPDVTGVAPATGTVGGGTAATIEGSGLAGVDQVWFGTQNPTEDPALYQAFQISGAALPQYGPASGSVRVSDQQIVACAPAVAGPQVVYVAVYSASGWSGVTASTQFTYTAGSGTPCTLASPGPVVAAGYMAGFPDGRFEPQGPTTRAEAAKVLAAVIAQRAPPPT